MVLDFLQALLHISTPLRQFGVGEFGASYGQGGRDLSRALG
jgi:hypothetical protein